MIFPLQGTSLESAVLDKVYDQFVLFWPWILTAWVWSLALGVVAGFIAKHVLANSQIGGLKAQIAAKDATIAWYEKRHDDVLKQAEGNDKRLTENYERLNQTRDEIAILDRQLHQRQYEEASLTSDSVARNIAFATNTNTSAQQANTDIRQIIISSKSYQGDVLEAWLNALKKTGGNGV